MKYFLLILFIAQIVCAVPLTTHSISNAVTAFVSSRFVQAQLKNQQTSTTANQKFSISEIKTLSRKSKTIGYVTLLNPTGFVLARADDDLPFTKLYSDSCSFSNIPPDFIEVMEWELSTELEILASAIKKDKNFTTKYKKEWENLLKPSSGSQITTEEEADFNEIGPLISTQWAQGDPYNIHAPSCGGSRVPIGCVATAMSQIMRYHNYPPAIMSDYTYTDNSGSCKGTYSASDAGLGDYQWEDMLLHYSGGASTAEEQAVAQLMYHSAVTVDMNFDSSGSGAYSQDVPPALRNYFNYSSDSVSYRNFYSDSVWYNKINNSLALQRPMYYAFQSTGGGGHAIVCDGCRNGDEIHLNFGWGGHNNAWYDMNYIPDGSYEWVDHDAIFNITPKEIFLTYQNYTVINDDNSDGHISPGETVDINVQILNAGGLDAYNVTAVLSTASAYVSVNLPAEISYGRIYKGMSGNGVTPYSIKIATNAPNEYQEMQLVISCDDKTWTNDFNLNVEHLPVIHVNPTNISLDVEGNADVSANVVISNSGISDLLVNLFDDISSGSTNYTWTDSNNSNGPPYLWRDISSIGTAVELGDNDKTAMIPIGFDFPFYGENFSQFIISANGGIGLTEGNVYRSNTKLPCGSTYAPGQFIAPFWDDLDSEGKSSIYYYAEANQLIISWINISRKGTSDKETFQVILRKNGQILFQYRNMNGTLNSATVGIQGGPQSGFNPPKHAVNVAYNIPFVTNNLAVSIRPAVGDSWIDYTPKEALISPEESNVFIFTCNSENLTGGLYNATISVMHNDPTVDSNEISIDFMVYKPTTLVKGKDRIISNGETTPSLLNNTDFGMAEINVEIITNLFSILNSGTTNLFLGDVLLTSGTNFFSILEYSESDVSAGDSTIFKLGFAPEESGIFTGRVQITSSDEFNNPYSFYVIGKGIPEPGIFSIYYFGFWIIYLLKVK